MPSHAASPKASTPAAFPLAAAVIARLRSLLTRVGSLSARQRLYGWLALVLGVVAVIVFSGTKESDAHDQARRVYGHDADQTHDDAPSESGSTRGAVPLQGMSEVEIPVRVSGFLFEDDNSRPGEVVSSGGRKSTFDLYFLRPSDTGGTRAERLYRRILVTRSPGHDGTIVLAVADEDVPVLLNLAQIGEYQLVRTSPASSDAVAREPSLRSRPWIRKIMGDESVVVVP